MTGSATTKSDFWSRRKARVAAEADADADAVAASENAAVQAAYEEKPDEEILADLGLPEPETLNEGDDFTGFLKSAVPERIRRRALRRLWLSNPVLANLDEMVDYGEDFTDAATVVENLQTTYQVGKGMLRHIEEMARQEEERANPPVADDVQDDAEDAMVGSSDDETPDSAPDPDPDPALVQTVETIMFTPAEPEVPPVPRRRMRFDYAADRSLNDDQYEDRV